ncbi:MAG: MutS-related protein [Nitrospiraceae bacterium]
MSDSPPPRPAQDRGHALQRLIRRADRLLARGEETSASFSRWRLAIFLIGAAASVAAYRQAWFHLGNGLLGLFIVLFLIVARYHNRLEDHLQQLRNWRTIKRRHVARLALDWPIIPTRPIPVPDGHPYAGDLDITGPHSLFHLLNTTVLSAGRERLAGWLLQQTDRLPDPTAWQARQDLIKELARLPLLRDRLALAAGTADAEIDCARIQALLDQPAGFPGLRPLLWLMSGLAAATLTLALLASLALAPNYWILSFAAYAAVQLLTSGRTAPVFGRSLSLQQELNRLGALCLYLESRSFTSTPIVRRCCEPILRGTARPSLPLARLARISQALSLRAHPLVHLAANALVPWDLWFTQKLETIRQQLRHELPAWVDRLAELDAASALGTFAYLHPEYRWPKPIEPAAGNGCPASILANALGHPLLPKANRVSNDLDLQGLGRILLITGSNMSGKSTFLRTIGNNTCLAQAGAPVCAASFDWSWVRIACCIRVDDSLEAGLSFFYAEVKRLKQLLDAAQDRRAHPLLFLIDEIFKGTNNRERLAGSRAFIQALAQSNGLGLVTTHDLELAQLERELPAATNAHFQERVEAKALSFDYRLRPGPCPTTNALRIMEMVGLPVPGQQA